MTSRDHRHARTLTLEALNATSPDVRRDFLMITKRIREEGGTDARAILKSVANFLGPVTFRTPDGEPVTAATAAARTVIAYLQSFGHSEAMRAELREVNAVARTIATITATLPGYAAHTVIMRAIVDAERAGRPAPDSRIAA